MTKTRTVNGLNAGDLNLLKGDIRKALRALGANKKAAAVMIAEETAGIAKDLIPNDAFSDKDGNRVDGVQLRETEGGATVTLVSPHKSNSLYPDAYYIEYGYGIKGVESHLAPAPANYNYYGELGHGYRDFWFYHDQYAGNRLSVSLLRGYRGAAPMYRSRMKMREMLNDPSSDIRAKLRAEFGLDDSFGG